MRADAAWPGRGAGLWPVQLCAFTKPGPQPQSQPLQPPPHHKKNLSLADARPASTDVRLEATDLRLPLSPDVLELGGLLAASALEPLMQAGAALRPGGRAGAGGMSGMMRVGHLLMARTAAPPPAR